MLTLTKDMETGIEKIDTQHKELISRINKLLEVGGSSASHEEVEKTIDYLGDYVVKHFSDEEELQINSKYPGYPEHKKLHTSFIDDFAKLKEEYEKNGNSMEFSMKLNNTLLTWIIKHIKGEDVEYGKYYKAQAL
jgi:hemerythrin